MNVASVSARDQEQAGRDRRERLRIHACNRILLYGQGLDLPAETCLDLAAESLRRTPENAGMAEIMSAMHQILAERDLTSEGVPAAHVPFASFPPLSRHSMVSEGPGCQSFLGWIVNCGSNLLRRMAPGNGRE